MKEAEATLFFALRSVYVWTILKPQLDCTLACFTSLEKRSALAHFEQYGSAQPSENIIFHGLDIPFSSVAKLDWDTITRLRADTRFKEFREWAMSLNGKPDVDIAKEIMEGIFSLLSKLDVSPKRAMTNLAVNLIPLPIPVNPLSIAMGIQDYMRTRDLHKEYRWLFAFLDLNKTS